MSRKSIRVDELAREAEVDLDEAVVLLWDVGIDYVDAPNSQVRRVDIKRAREALDLVDNREQRTIDYWLALTGLDRDTFTQKMAEIGVHVAANARNLPKGGMRRARTRFLHENPAPRPAAETSPPKAEKIDPFRWETIGNASPSRYLMDADVLAIHEVLEEDAAQTSDPIQPPGVRDHSLLSSAVSRPHTSLGGELKYPTIEMAAAALFHSVVLNHAFHNGNKRAGLVSLVAFLDVNGRVLTCEHDELFKVTLQTAAHRLVPSNADNFADREVLEIARWIRTNSRQLDRQERPMKWIKLRRRLRELGCDSEPAHGVGNRINITRMIHGQGLLRKQSRYLSTQVFWAGDGTEAQKNTIHKIRLELELDEQHGVDGRAFYDGLELDSMVIEYRNILRRLAKL